jgi:hypothetical protein
MSISLDHRQRIDEKAAITNSKYRYKGDFHSGAMHCVPMACSYFCPRIGHLEIDDQTIFELPNRHLKKG